MIPLTDNISDWTFYTHIPDTLAIMVPALFKNHSEILESS